jgi:cation:H+ antiporter
MFLSIVLVVAGLTLLVFGGEVLLRGAVGLATLLRLTPAVIGLTVVAAGTSVPELAVSGVAAWQGKADIAVANIVGSNLFNVTVIIGLCALMCPIAIAGNTVKLEYPVLALVTLLCLVIAQDGVINRLDGTLCLAVYVGFTAYLVSLVRDQLTREQQATLQGEVKEILAESPLPRPRWWMCTVLITAGTLLLGGGAHLTVTGASDIARVLGWSERIIGLTIVSMGTGLPEVVASLVSSYRGRSDMAIGNVIGSNLFNILVIQGLSALVSPLPVQENLVSYDGVWMLGLTLALFPLMYTSMRISRAEGGLLIAAYVCYLFLLLRQA